MFRAADVAHSTCQFIQVHPVRHGYSATDCAFACWGSHFEISETMGFILVAARRQCYAPRILRRHAHGLPQASRLETPRSPVE